MENNTKDHNRTASFYYITSMNYFITNLFIKKARHSLLVLKLNAIITEGEEDLGQKQNHKRQKWSTYDVLNILDFFLM